MPERVVCPASVTRKTQTGKAKTHYCELNTGHINLHRCGRCGLRWEAETAPSSAVGTPVSSAIMEA